MARLLPLFHGNLASGLSQVACSPQFTSNWMILHRCIRKESVSYLLSAFAQSLNIHTKKIDLYALTFAIVYSATTGSWTPAQHPELLA
jgi:hypothetical protein